jgi:putative ABC transport system ATP-binding protein
MPELSIRENVELPARLRGTLAADGPTVERLLVDLGLEELAGRPPAETSIGQQQRTALARALVLQPAVLLADEPSSHQDAGFRDRVWEQIAKAAAAGTACLIATHEDEAAASATRLWRISDGTPVPA